MRLVVQRQNQIQRWLIMDDAICGRSSKNPCENPLQLHTNSVNPVLLQTKVKWEKKINSSELRMDLSTAKRLVKELDKLQNDTFS